MKCYGITNKEDKKLRELALGVERLGEGSREYIRQVSRALISVQESLVLPMPAEKDMGDGRVKGISYFFGKE
ncbi:hypothetical protein AGMMS4952_18430 [Spirochaetia bacterium]|nr:hypothetical protein AGMMS4952_18430 [Spirochaetia bacterium]